MWNNFHLGYDLLVTQKESRTQKLWKDQPQIRNELQLHLTKNVSKLTARIFSWFKYLDWLHIFQKMVKAQGAQTESFQKWLRSVFHSFLSLSQRPDKREQKSSRTRTSKRKTTRVKQWRWAVTLLYQCFFHRLPNEVHVLSHQCLNYCWLDQHVLVPMMNIVLEHFFVDCSHH